MLVSLRYFSSPLEYFDLDHGQYIQISWESGNFLRTHHSPRVIWHSRHYLLWSSPISRKNFSLLESWLYSSCDSHACTMGCTIRVMSSSEQSWGSYTDTPDSILWRDSNLRRNTGGKNGLDKWVILKYFIYMKKVFVTFAIYVVFILWIWLLLTSSTMIASQMNGCLWYNENSSFLAEWLNITYFEEKEQYETCIHISLIHKTQQDKELFCKYPLVPGVCDRPNFKPGILYWLLWILIFYSGIRLRKKYVLH